MKLELVCCEGSYLKTESPSVRVEFVYHTDKETEERQGDERFDGSVEVYYVVGDNEHIWTQEVDVTREDGLDIIYEIFMAINHGGMHIAHSMRERWE